jgi:predicted AAA+ superfamily ATPase
MVIHRRRHLDRVSGLLERFPVVGIVGARQVGKTTLARQLAEGDSRPVTFFDLEDPGDLARLADPMLAIKDLEGLVVIDEVQRAPELFSVLRVLADRPTVPAQFLILGSASPQMLRQSSESLAGRVAYFELDGFSPDEVGVENLGRLWIRGGFPRSFLAESDRESLEWRLEFIRTFLERDLPQLGITVSSTTLRRLWTMLAHSHGQIWNASAFARSFGLADTTIRRYLDILTSTFVARQLAPWHANLRKRQVKSPKVYLTDSGLLHALLNLGDRNQVEAHPQAGASWEGFASNILQQRLEARSEECFFWATHAGAEIDLMVVRGNVRLGFEFKKTVAPRTTRSMHVAMDDLNLEGIEVVHAGDETFPLAAGIRALPLSRVYDDLDPLD